MRRRDVDDQNVSDIKQRVAVEARALHPRLIQISQTIHANPELLFQEHKAMN
jgi:metal-dependent amidase/aminoacylase/carboxypeptidase family protein